MASTVFRLAVGLFASCGMGIHAYGDARDAIDFSGYAEIQQRFFPQRENSAQSHSYESAALNPQWRFDAGKSDALTLRLFARHDFDDSSRTHADVREALWQHLRGNQEWRVGIDEVFWGVVESRHLVDIINQKDMLERIDGDAKLGQPLLNWNWRRNRTSLEVFVLPYFREQKFADPSGRLRPPLRVIEPEYANGAQRRDTSTAVRWQFLGEDADVALSYFDGISREPQFRLASRRGELRIQPTYVHLTQTGLEAQKSTGNWLLKAEAVYREDDESSWAGVTGFEYTFDDVLRGDLGVMLEYLRDTRDWQPRETFQDDIFAGLRYASSTLSSTNILAGFYQERQRDGHVFKLEANTRLGESAKLTFEFWRFDELSETELASFFAKDDYVQISLQYYFQYYGAGSSQ